MQLPGGGGKSGSHSSMLVSHSNVACWLAPDTQQMFNCQQHLLQECDSWSPSTFPYAVFWIPGARWVDLVFTQCFRWSCISKRRLLPPFYSRKALNCSRALPSNAQAQVVFHKSISFKSSFLRIDTVRVLTPSSIFFLLKIAVATRGPSLGSSTIHSQLCVSMYGQRSYHATVYVEFFAGPPMSGIIINLIGFQRREGCCQGADKSEYPAGSWQLFLPLLFVLIFHNVLVLHSS